MAGKIKEHRDKMELDLRLQVENLSVATAKSPINKRKIQLEMKKTETAMDTLKYTQTTYCKAANINPSGSDSLAYLRPNNTLYQNAMDAAIALWPRKKMRLKVPKPRRNLKMRSSG